MEEEMEVEEMVFEAHEVDPVYEFDAAMFFDFNREESPEEASAAEVWFASARSYPPSPFVASLVLRDESLMKRKSDRFAEENENAAASMIDGYIDREGTEISGIEAADGGWDKLYRGICTNSPSGNPEEVPDQQRGFAAGWNAICTDKSKPRVKSSVKPYLSRSSTLMKPTASALAKQNRPLREGGSRFQMLWPQKESSLCKSSVLLETQAAKRQKVEGGHLCKVGDTKLQTDFFHKATKKAGNAEKSSVYTKLRLTIPREPSLETTQRAQRMRSKNGAEQEQVTAAAPNFKACPLKRKILKGPTWPLPKKSTPKLPEFQEFHLRTLERAMQHTSAVSSSSLPCDDSNKFLKLRSNNMTVAENGKEESRRPSTIDDAKQGRNSTMHLFKARPLNKKVLSSKGDIGVFWNSKKETTVPMEFDLHTEKRNRHNTPIELFSKLSLTSELQPNNGSQLQVPQPGSISLKGSKENILNPLQTEHKVTQLVKERPPMHVGQKIQSESNGRINEVGNQASRRSLGIH